jgi:hypothetical protein
MAKQTINLGTVAGDGTGDPLRTALDKVNDNFDEVYAADVTAAAHIASTSNPHSVTKTQLGLGNCDNTSDANKPISTATQTALDLKAPLASPALTGVPTAPTAAGATSTTQLATTAFVQQELNSLLDGAPGALNTLNELAAAVNDDASFAATVTTALSGKAASVHTHAQSDVTNLVADLAGKAASVHTHAQSDVTGLVAALEALLPKAGGTMTGALAITAGSLTTSPLAVTQTWNNAGVTCRGLEWAVTNTNSASGSTLLRILGGAAGTTQAMALSALHGSLSVGAASNSATLTIIGSDRSGSLELGSFSNGLCSTGSHDIKGNNGLLRFYNGNATVQYASLYGEEAGVLALRKGDGTAVGASWEMLEMTSPASPAADRLRLYAEDNGSGKTRLVVKFSDGTTAVLATQP